MFKILRLVFVLFVQSASAQTYGTTQWEMGTVNPYNFGANLSRTLYNLGSISPLGVWSARPSSLAIQGNSVATGFSPDYQSFFQSGNYTGTGTGPFAEVSVNDTAADNVSGTALVGWRVDHSMNAGSGAGNRTAIQGILTQNAPTTGTDPLLKFYTGIFGQVYVNSNDGGTALRPYGDYYGAAGIAQINSAAGPSAYFAGVSNEFDVSVQAPTHIQFKNVLTAISVNSDAVKGTMSDAMFVMTRDNTSTAKFDYGISFGRRDSSWPIDSNGTLIGIEGVGTGPVTARNGLDFTAVTFLGNSVKVPGFSIDASGNYSHTGAFPLWSMNDTASSITSGGLVRFLGNGGSYVYQINTAAGGDFSSVITAFDVNASGRMTFQYPITAGGGAPSSSGSCAITSKVGGNFAGKFSMSASCTNGTVVLTFNSASPNGYSCDAHDLTTPTALFDQTAYSTTSATFTNRSVAAAADDVVVFKCVAY